ncbi:MAG: ATP-binding cassette domain-containing protein [Acidimicrobiia bacterium]|nr:ATP-binding cassette domain-containing protein [Acidimicrobiia bacterium]
MTAADPAGISAAVRTDVVASVRDLRVYFGTKAGIVHAVDGVDFDIRDGETLGLVGETGCGKSVTARSFLRLVPMPPGIAVSGSILFRPRSQCTACGGAGCAVCENTGRVVSDCQHCSGSGCPSCDGSGVETVDLMSISERQLRQIRGDRIAMIFQDPGKALNPALSIRDQLGEVFFTHRSQELLDRAGFGASDADGAGVLVQRHAALRTRGIERMILAVPPLRGKRNALMASADDMIVDALSETQIPNPRKVMDRYPHELSGGMKQRVMIAQALACDPDLLIADEPTTALDVTVQARIMDLISELQERHRTAVLYISHDLSLVRRIADRTAVMYAGQIAEIGESEQIFRDPQHPYTRGLIDAIPSVTHERGRLAAIAGNVPELIDPDPVCRFASRCSYAAAVCETTEPALHVADGEHMVACFLHNAPPGTPAADLPVRARSAR